MQEDISLTGNEADGPGCAHGLPSEKMSAADAVFLRSVLVKRLVKRIGGEC